MLTLPHDRSLKGIKRTVKHKYDDDLEISQNNANECPDVCLDVLSPEHPLTVMFIVYQTTNN